MKKRFLFTEYRIPDSGYLEKGSQRGKKKLPPTGFEPVAPGLGNLCSIHLSYGGKIWLDRKIYDMLPFLFNMIEC